jgi:tRNA (cytidine32/uridine32-2'-O)-methyltransferase
MLEHIRIILVNTSHPGNIGAAARAMMNMGLSRLYLVTPKRFPHADATARASGATGILKNAVVCDTLEEALGGCQLVFAASARSRSLPWPMSTPRECAATSVSSTGLEIALMFGNERAGLTNDELALAHRHVCIPTVSNFSSLNLAQAVQVLTYELFMATQGDVSPESTDDEPRELCTQEQMLGMMNHLEQVLFSVEFLNPKHPKLLMKRLQRLYYRANMDVTEINILRGILTSIDKKLPSQ